MANEIRRTFKLSNKDEIGNIKRIFKREDGSQHLIENFMTTELVDLISMKEIREKKNILLTLNIKTDLSIGHAEFFFEAITAEKYKADILGCQVIDPFICIRLYIHRMSGDRLEIVSYYIRGIA